MQTRKLQTRGNARFGWAPVILIAALYVAVSICAFQQAPRENPLAPPTTFETFFKPREKNAFLQLQQINGTINDIFTLPDNAELIWIVGNEGFITHSNDGGDTWNQQHYPVSSSSENLEATSSFSSTPKSKNGKTKTQSTKTTPKPLLNAVYFLTDTKGYAVGEEGTLLKTMDGGNTWDKYPVQTQASLCCIYVHNEKVLIAGDNIILRSVDDEGNWKEPINFPDKPKSMVFVNENEGWIFSSVYAYKTIDGGNSWIKIEPNSDHPYIEYFNYIKDKGLLARIYNEEMQNYFVAASKDDGQSWEPIKGSDETFFSNVSFFGSAGIAIDTNQIIWKTSDDGKTWQQTNSNNNSITDYDSKIVYLDGASPLIFEASGSIKKSTDGGASWQPKTFTVYDLDFSSNFGLAVGTSGSILKTIDNGITWNPIKNLDNGADIYNVDIIGSEAIAITSTGTLFHSSDEGEIWEKIKSPKSTTPEYILQVQLFDDGSVKTINMDGTIETSTNKGSTWTTKKEGLTVKDEPFSAKFFDRNNGIGRKNKNGLLYTEDGGTTWQEADTPKGYGTEKYTLIEPIWLNKKIAFVTSNSTILKTIDGGASWTAKDTQVNDTRTEKSVYSDIDFSKKENGNVGLAVGANGLIARTVDDGETWTFQKEKSQHIFASVNFIDANNVVISTLTSFLTSGNGGVSWEEIKYSRSLAPWYWLLSILFAIFILWYFSRKSEPYTQENSITDLLASDRPLRPGDPDPLEFGGISQGLSRFMRNPGTEPPLTLAITGAWGTGKSSLMNLLYCDLKSYGFTPVWFNAWHHQKGEQLLASLYANIRDQAIPGWFSFSRMIPVGLLFRINLLFRRSVKNWMTTLVLISLLATVITCLLIMGYSNQLLPLWDELGKTEFNAEKLLIPLLGAPAAFLLWAMRAFDLKPVDLITGSSADSDSNSINPSARQQFAREFSDVAKSLALGRIVIFIDDLDRCSKENVVDILEAINFLSVSGDCYIVLGMDEAWVKICVEQQFPDMAERNFDFAEHYLEKMINIKIPVPLLSDGHSSKLLALEVTTKQANLSEFKKSQLKFLKSIQHYRHVLIIFFAISLGVFLGVHSEYGISEYIKTSPSIAPKHQRVITWKNIDLQQIELSNGQPGFILDTRNQEQLNKPTTKGWEISLEATTEAIEQGIELGKIDGDSASLVLRKTTQSGKQINDGEKDSNNTQKNISRADLSSTIQENQYNNLKELLIILVAAAMLTIYTYLYRIRTAESRPQDSEVFKEALAIWQDWILLNQQTPRAIKRYVNRVRYIVMRFRPEDPPPQSLLSALKKQFVSNSNDQESTRSTSTKFEANLVALSAIYAVNKKWLMHDENFQQIQNKDLSSLIIQFYSDTNAPLEQIQLLIERLTTAITEHQKNFGASFISDEERKKFLKILADI